MSSNLMLVAMYELPDSRTRVCLGVRIGNPDQIDKYRKRLVLQIRNRYPEFFSGMRPRQVESKLDLDVYSLVPDKQGYPRWQGEVSWWAP